MGTLFQDLSRRGLPPELPCLLDWLFDDKRFQGDCWDQTAKATFTKRIRGLEGMGIGAFNRKSKSLRYPVFASKRNRKKKPLAVISSSGSLGVDLVRHIRNGLAHGSAEIYTANALDFIEVKDFSRKGQTAYIAVPLSYLFRIYRIYKEIEGEHAVRGSP